jgi:hypothetical protein
MGRGGDGWKKAHVLYCTYRCREKRGELVGHRLTVTNDFSISTRVTGCDHTMISTAARLDSSVQSPRRTVFRQLPQRSCYACPSQGSGLLEAMWFTAGNAQGKIQLFPLLNSPSKLAARPAKQSLGANPQKIHVQKRPIPRPPLLSTNVVSAHAVSRAGQTTSHHAFRVTPTFKIHLHTPRSFPSSLSPDPA